MPAFEELLTAFRTLYAETVRPDVEGIVRSSERRVLEEVRRDMNGHFDAVHQRLGHLETEYRMLVVGLRRAEDAQSQGTSD
jgi:hypothetical protein